MNIDQENRTKKLQKDAINVIFKKHEKFIVIALSGKIGSGCSTVAEQFTKDISELKLSKPEPGMIGFSEETERECRLLQRFYTYHYQEFRLIKVRDLIITFLLENGESWKRFLEDIEMNDKEIDNIIIKKVRECIERKITIININSKNDEKVGKLRKALDILNKDANLIKINRNTYYNEKELEKGNECYYIYITEILPIIGKILHEEYITEKYTELFQKYGNKLRFFGSLNQEKIKSNTDLPEDIDYCANIFTIANRINQTIKILREPKQDGKKEDLAVVIDSLKNIFESMYLKNKYSAYYLFSISKDEDKRKNSISKRKQSLSVKDIAFIDYNERPSVTRKKIKSFAKIFYKDICESTKKKTGENEKNLLEFLEATKEGKLDELLRYAQEGKICEKENIAEYKKLICSIPYNDQYRNESGISQELFEYYQKTLFDPLRVYAFLSGLHQFYLQNVETCIQNADVFLTNNEATKVKHFLNQNIVRYVSLILHPGLVTPTPIERCMQIAYTAKVNSGCISRQVGAVVTDAEYNILSLGWNDPPHGQVSCNLRNLYDVFRDIDGKAYSDYERSKESPFGEYLAQFDFSEPSKLKDLLNGLPLSYCFKDCDEEMTGNRNPMNARAMHGEEKALLICDQQRVKGGNLFTTSSPCEMCAKNAKEHNISKIYYIEPYPGISQSHICNSGNLDNRAKYILFEGAIGRAYTQMYTPVMSYKDELSSLGINELKKVEDNEVNKVNGDSDNHIKV